MALIGYARVSTHEQNLDLQLDALKAAGCNQIFEDKGVSGIVEERDGLSEALSLLGKGDILVVWKLDRLGRSLGFLCELIERFAKQGIGFRSLQDGLDTSTAGGRLVYHVMGAMAEFERSLISERTKEGMQAAKRRGRHIGRPRVASEAQLKLARKLLATHSMKDTAEAVGLHYNTLRRHILT